MTKYIKREPYYLAAQFKGVANAEEVLKVVPPHLSFDFALDGKTGSSSGLKISYPTVDGTGITYHSLEQGDWLVRYPDGTLLAMSDEDFQKEFEPVDTFPRFDLNIDRNILYGKGSGG